MSAGLKGYCKSEGSSWSRRWDCEESVLQQAGISCIAQAWVVWKEGQIAAESSQASPKTER